jgi:hypothetical protein
MNSESFPIQQLSETVLPGGLDLFLLGQIFVGRVVMPRRLDPPHDLAPVLSHWPVHKWSSSPCHFGNPACLHDSLFRCHALSFSQWKFLLMNNVQRLLLTNVAHVAAVEQNFDL